MSAGVTLSVAERIDLLMRELGITKAHFAARLPADWTGSAEDFPDRIASLTLVCPPAIPASAIDAVAPRTLVFSGDRGPFAGAVKQIAACTSGTTFHAICDYAGALWDDVIADHADEIGAALLAFLHKKRADDPQTVSVSAQPEGEVAQVTYRVRGSGPPLILLPLALSPSQWEALVARLAKQYCTITLGGAPLGVVAGLEERATTVGFLNMFRNLVLQAGLTPGQTVLEVGPGTGTFARWLATETRGENPITGVDINAYLVGEAVNLGVLSAEEAEDGFFIAAPHRCAIGTRAGRF
jgi:hypothetical protein